VCTLIKHTHDPGCVAEFRAATQQPVRNALAKRYKDFFIKDFVHPFQRMASE
jgi:hypothetical protein